jgi:hypothetical protein
MLLAYESEHKYKNTVENEKEDSESAIYQRITTQQKLTKIGEGM